MAATIVIVPDMGGTDRRHWLMHWRSNYPDLMRVADYDAGDATCRNWVRGIEDAVASAGPRTSLVAHGLGCLAVAHWAAQTYRPIEAAMLVSIPDLAAKPFSQRRLNGFSPVPRVVLPFRTLIVASAEDGAYEHAMAHADDWDATLVLVDSISHHTAPKARHTWDEGLSLLWNLVDPVLTP
ncbi:alpha/beta hydrolase [Piscinibacter sp. HJYY11]|uniref:RBBP9/YdeN family alpha/beta hydrolase n=1 Tax=Piscinibacter sp. HJYY11 TaxID=2801333 RepID=UPI00191DB7D2|nr:alpha/beta hydrolase [Piscinibacter sp. HJYY11]MBL0729880.1 serine hydrolase family protein [Piscinibacter sp. HJYY11]